MEGVKRDAQGIISFSENGCKKKDKQERQERRTSG